MNKQVIFVGLGTFGLGTVLGYFGAKITLEKKMGQEMKDQLEMELRKLKKAQSSTTDKAVHTPISDSEEGHPARPTKPSLQTIRQQAQTDYTKFFGTNPGDPIGEDEEVDDDESEEEDEIPHEPATLSLDERESSEPYFIAEGEAGEEYDVETLSIFRDKIVVDDQNLPINADDILGVANLNTFYSANEDQMYIRNDKLRVDYELLRERTNYAQMIEDRPHLRR